MRTSLLIVDDHRVFCQGLEAVFAAEPDFEPMAISNPDQALGVVAAWRPDVVIMDLRLGEVSGVDLTRQMTALPFPPAVVVLTAYADIAMALDAIRAEAGCRTNCSASWSLSTTTRQGLLSSSRS